MNSKKANACLTRIDTPKKAPGKEAVSDSARFYIFKGESGGFVIVSGDDRARRILAYSLTGSIDVDNMPQQLSGLLEWYSEIIANLPSNIVVHPSPASLEETTGPSNSVLLETYDWGQGDPYNTSCPVIGGVHSQAGCVATAMAIVMKYHNWPPKGRGHHKYNTNRFGMDLDEMDYEKITFDFDAMSPEGNSEVAKLMRTAGHSVNMVYGTELSGTYVWVAPNAMRRYFSYSPECQYIEKSHFQDNEWSEILHSQLDSGLPVIYSGFTEDKEGHAFVIDGYENDMYHINWGWDGMFNGYFSLSPAADNAIPEYNQRQGMVINIIPDTSGKELSPCWIDYGYLWREMDSDPLLNTNPGTYVYPSTFEKGKEFDFYSKTINVPVDYACSFGVAVVDANGDIKHVAPAYMTIDKGSYTVFCTINYTWNSVTLSTPTSIDIDLPENYTLWVASQEKGSDIWKLIPGTMEAPSTCIFDDRDIPLSSINYSFNDVAGVVGSPDNDDDDFVYSVNSTDPFKAIIGSNYLAICKANNGVANIYLDGEWATNTDDVYRSTLQFKVFKDTYDITVDYIGNEDLTSVVLENATPGSVPESLSDCEKIKSLVVHGSVHAGDLAYITEHCISLQHLDLSDVDIVSHVDEQGIEYRANTFPRDNYRPSKTVNDQSSLTANIWNVKSLILPKSMTGWSGRFNTMELGGRNLIALSIHAGYASERTETYISGNSGLGDISFQFVNCTADETAGTLSEVSFLSGVNKYGHLFVPSGMKDKFTNAAGWKEFRHIIEVDKPFNGAIVEKDGAQYILLSDCAALISVPVDCINSRFSVADSIIHGDESYPVRYIATQALTAKPINHIELPAGFEELDLNVFFGSHSITLNQNLESIIPQESVYLVGGVLYLRNEKSLDLSMMDSYIAFSEKTTPNFTTDKAVQRVYVPGATTEIYKETLPTAAEIAEMWTYEIDKEKKLVRITPKLDDLSVDKVSINGRSIEPVLGVYNYADVAADELDVALDYTMPGGQNMSTRYDNQFNAAMPSVEIEFSGVSETFTDSESAADVYDVKGVLLLKDCDISKINTLDPGIYIIQRGEETTKIIIR